MSTNLESFISKSVFCNFQAARVEEILRKSKVDKYEPDSEIPKPNPQEEILFILDGEAALCDGRNPRIELQYLDRGKSLELGRYLRKSDWQYFWKTKSRVEIIRLPWMSFLELVKTNPLFGDYMIRIVSSPEVQKFNRALRQMEISSAARMQLIASLNHGPFEKAFGDTTQRKFVILSSGRIRINCYINGAKIPILELQGGDDFLADTRAENISLEVIVPGEAWFLPESDWVKLKSFPEAKEFLTLYEKKHSHSTRNMEVTEIGTSPALTTKNKAHSIIKIPIEMSTSFKLSVLLLFLASSLAICLQFFSTLLNRIVFDKVLGSHDANLAMVIVTVSGIASVWNESVQKHMMAVSEYLGRSHKLKKITEVFERLARVDAKYYTDAGEGGLVQKYNNLSEYLTLQMRFKLETIKWAISFFTVSVLFYCINPKLSWSIVISVIWVGVYGYFTEALGSDITKKRSLLKGEHNETSFDLVNVVTAYKSFNLWSAFKSQWKSSLNKLDAATFIENNFKGLQSQALDLLSELYKLVVLFYGVILFIDRQMSLGLVIALPLLLGTYIAQLRRLFGLFQLKTQITHCEEKSLNPDELPAIAIKDDQFTENAEIAVEAKNLNFSYQGLPGEFSISRVDIKIKKGEKVLILGPSGSGKSTLLRVLAGVLHADGVERHYDKGNAQIYLAQDSGLLPGTLAQNITNFEEEVPFDQIQEISQELEIAGFIDKLPLNYNTIISPQSVQFSDGEMQRIQLARLFFKSYQVCYMDESTSLLDPITEQRLLNKIFRNLQEKAVVFATQKCLIVPFFDRVIFVNNGKIVEDGTHAELLKNRGQYFEYFCSQIRNL